MIIGDGSPFALSDFAQMSTEIHIDLLHSGGSVLWCFLIQKRPGDNLHNVVDPMQSSTLHSQLYFFSWGKIKKSIEIYSLNVGTQKTLIFSIFFLGVPELGFTT